MVVMGLSVSLLILHDSGVLEMRQQSASGDREGGDTLHLMDICSPNYCPVKSRSLRNPSSYHPTEAAGNEFTLDIRHKAPSSTSQCGNYCP